MLQMVRHTTRRTLVRFRSGWPLAAILVSVVLGASALAQSPKPGGNPAGVSNFVTTHRTRPSGITGGASWR